MRAVLLTFLLVAASAAASAQTIIDSGSTGADGPFDARPIGLFPLQFGPLPPNTEVQCDELVAPGVRIIRMPCTLTLQLREPPSHVFNFTSITIPADVTVRFKRNRANTPVVILARENVTIDGTIDVSAEGRRGGPGGFDGGTAGIPYGGAGLGPGGGRYEVSVPGPFLRLAASPCFADCYGNPELRPLIGGSGGGGLQGAGFDGGGGGGAILIASSQTVDLGSAATTPAISANGGEVNLVGQGSGGAIRLVASTITGSRGLEAVQKRQIFQPAYPGRIRIEAPL